MKTNYFRCGDAVELMRELPDASVDLLIADPPYNLGKDYGNNKDLKAWRDYGEFTREWLIEAVRLMKPTSSIYVFMGVRFISNLYMLMEDEFSLNFNGWITWHYTQGMGRKRGFSPRHEDLLFFTKTNSYVFNLDDVRIPQKYFRKRNNMNGANPGDVWQFSHVHYCSAEREKHPTQKPEALLERMIGASSNEGDLVLDPFSGSGTTCRVAKIMSRKWIGIDLNPEYIKMGEKRVKQKSIELDSVDPRLERIPKDLPKKLGDEAKSLSDDTLFQTLPGF